MTRFLINFRHRWLEKLEKLCFLRIMPFIIRLLSTESMLMYRPMNGMLHKKCIMSKCMKNCMKNSALVVASWITITENS